MGSDHHGRRGETENLMEKTLGVWAARPGCFRLGAHSLYGSGSEANTDDVISLKVHLLVSVAPHSYGRGSLSLSHMGAKCKSQGRQIPRQGCLRLGFRVEF